MKVKKEEFLTRIREKYGDGDELIGVLEDFEDSFTHVDDITSPDPDYESDDNPYKGKYTDIYGKYVDRFINGGKEKSEVHPSNDDITGNIPGEGEEIDLYANSVISKDMVELFGVKED